MPQTLLPVNSAPDTESNRKYLERAFSATPTAIAGGVGAIGLVLATESAVTAAPSPEVQAVVTNALDTIPLLTGVCMAVFGAGLAPWAARTTLSWLSSIMKGAI
jgi:hypothetical protein